MPANNISNLAYDRVPLGEYDDNDGWTKRIDEFDINANRIFDDNEKDALKGYIPESKIQVCPEVITRSSSTKFPKEIRKAFLAFLLMTFGFLCNTISIVLTHQKIPDRNLHPPLPDIALDNLTKRRWLNDVADILVIVCAMGVAVIVILHKYRWILCRRIFLILSMLYSLRSVTMYVTVLPLANDHVYCSPKINQTLSYDKKVVTVIEEAVKLLLTGGLPITGKKTICGDYIFSGHTVILMMTYLLVREYIPRRYSTIHWSSWIIAWIGMISLLISHGHYTVDVIIGYYATTRMFWIYHTFANNPELHIKSSTNSLSDVWWFPIFRYFEGNISGKIPNEYSVPRLRRKTLTVSSRKDFYE